MNSKSIAILFFLLLSVIISSSLLIRFNTKKGDYTPPPADFEQNRQTFETLIQNAQAAKTANSPERAFELYRAALAYYPKNQGILTEMGNLKIDSKNFSQAEKIFSELVQLSPDNPNYKTTLAYILINLNKFSEAKNLITQLKVMKINDSRIYLIEAVIDAQNKQTDNAISHLNNFTNLPILLNFLEEPFFDPIRQEENFQTFKNKISENIKKASP